jgi:hypothetical protein
MPALVVVTDIGIIDIGSIEMLKSITFSMQ